MLGLLAAALAFQTIQPFSQRLNLKLTGKNGYEEYLLAADIVRSPEASLILRWTPGMTAPAPPPKGRDADSEYTSPSPGEQALYALLPKLSPLDVRREAVNRFGKALDLIAAGNAKPVYDPRGDATVETLFPEYSSFRSISRLAVYASQVFAADGRTDRAVKTLTDQLYFADNFGRGLIISNLVGVSSSSIALAAFGELLPRMSRADAIRIQADVRSLLDRPVAIRTVWPVETGFAIRALSEALASKNDPSKLLDPYSDDDDEETDPKTKAFAKQLSKSTPAQRQEILRSVQRQLEGRARMADRILSGPEKNWIPGFNEMAEGDDGPSQDIASFLVSMVTPTYTQFVVAAVRSREQWRLLGLHAKLLQYRWDYGRYPATLNETDPLTGQAYLYEIHPDGSIRLASRGTKETGEIELKYKRKAEEPEVKP